VRDHLTLYLDPEYLHYCLIIWILTASNIELEIETVIRNYEPRVSLVRVKATPNYDANEIDVEIVYNIIGVDVPQQQLEFALQPTR